MNKIITHLDLDLASSNEYKIINAQQLDNNTRRLEVNLFHEGKIYDISNVTRIELQGSRGDGLVIKTTLSHNGNTIIVDFDDTILGAKGLCKLKIALYNSRELLSSFPFIIRVDENVYDENGIIASPVYSELDEALKKVKDIETKESSRVEAENKRVSSEQARNNAESTRIKAEESRVSSENERRNSETSRVSEFTNMKNELSEIVENNKNINIEAIAPDDEHYQVKVTDKNGTSKTSANLLSKLSIGTVETGEYDEVPTANITGKFGEQKLNLRLPIGKPFKIKKTYSSITDMNQNIQADLDLYEFCMIDTGSVQDEDTAKLYMRDVDGAHYITDLSGAQGIQGVKGETGATPNLTIGTVETGEPGTDVVVTVTGTDENPIFNFTIPKGEKGDNGENATITSTATKTKDGLMSSSDKTKLDGIEAGANKTVIDTELSSTSTNPVQNKVINTAIESLKKSVSDGKGTVASAITNMGVSTASDATFATMATNVKKIFPTPAQFAAKYKNTFRALANAPVNFNGATAVCHDKRIYVHGSCAAAGGDFKSMYCYDIVSNTWAKLASSPVEHQWQNNVVLVGDSILYFGNWTGVSIHLYQYNISWNTWTDRNVSIPLAAQGASAFMQGGAIRLLSSQYISYKNNYYYYSLITNTFTKGANLTDADAADIYGAQTASITVGDKVYLICAKSAKIKIFNVGDFKTIENVVSPGKSFGCSTKVGNLIYTASTKYANTPYIFNMSTKTFTKLFSDHYGSNAGCVNFGDEVFYIGSNQSGHENKATNIHTTFCLDNLY